jgi:anti-sigma B factor antagonist
VITSREDRVTGDSDSPVILITGDLDSSTFANFRTQMLGALGAPTVKVDLHDVGFSDSAGLNALVRTHYDLAQEDRRLVLVNVPPRLQRLLQLSGLDQTLHIET